MIKPYFLRKGLPAALALAALAFGSLRAQMPAWNQVPSPNPGPVRTMVRGMAGTSTNEVWAVGHYQTSPAGLFQYNSENLILRWNGSNWTEYDVPNPTQNQGDLWDVSAAGPSDVWAVGTYVIPGGGGAAQILHWNGSAWQPQDLSHIPNAQMLWGVKARAANDVWAVGIMSASDAFVLHYNGTAWRKVPVPPVTTFRNRFDAVDAISATDAWAVGTYGHQSGDFNLMAQHWDGTVWRNVPFPAGTGQGEVLSVKMVASDNVWAVADMETGQMQMFHWDGTAWSLVPSNGGGGDLAILGPNDIYAVGNEISHYNGSSWTIVDSLRHLPYAALGDAVVLPNGEIWAGGRTIDAYGVFRSLIYRRGPGGQQLTAGAANPVIQPGASTQLSATLAPQGQVTYSWSPGASLSDSTAADPVARPTATTLYTLNVTYGDSTMLQRAVRIQVSGPAGLDDAAKAGGLRAYPNPAKGRVMVEDLKGGEEVWLVSPTGQHVRRLSAQPGRNELPLEGLRPGLYLLWVRDVEVSMTSRVVIE